MKDIIDTPIDEDDLSIELPDIDLDKEAGRQPKPHSSIPASIKYGLLGLLFFVVVLGVVLINVIAQPGPVEEGVVFDQTALSDIAALDSPAVIPALPVAADPSPSEQVSVDNSETVERLNAMVLSLQQALDQSSLLVAKQRDAAARQGGSIQEVVTRLEQSRALITETARQVGDLNARLAALETRVGQNQDHLRQIKTKVTRKQRPLKPAFQLLSIDQWGNQESVVLELQNQTTVAAVGDTRAGWSIQSIDRPNCIGVVRLSDQSKAKVCKRSS